MSATVTHKPCVSMSGKRKMKADLTGAMPQILLRPAITSVIDTPWKSIAWKKRLAVMPEV